jgi:hypothetical protein
MVECELDRPSQISEPPPMPKALFDAGGIVEVEYASPLNHAQRTGEGLAILRTIKGVTLLANVDPGVMLLFDTAAVARGILACSRNPSPEALLREAICTHFINADCIDAGDSPRRLDLDAVHAARLASE